jgi:hypothetical protein
MFDTDTASSGVKFARLEGQLLSHEIDRAAFVDLDQRGVNQAGKGGQPS